MNGQRRTGEGVGTRTHGRGVLSVNAPPASCNSGTNHPQMEV
jgi:hypothetical protein